ncbi:protein kinase domain-containing protein [Mycolicibacter senuensis]|uniref:non-specific serine/threonine protein kinase n=1 Tax=Mycolicibacter senuensis TaxID=386913 RepID=A0A7I9XIV6_9MYCO|nr:protein kinase [Mycolicibacter senuensis]ORW68591.1 serine/threonine protein kinase [Mycolicibacter senuensis]GFG69834.1 serine/threonine-protein kinase PknL [Mycolicibacter senuensis]
MTAAWGPDALEGALLDGRYRVGTRIATGGTSTVYRGLDERLDRPVACKVMDLRYAGDQQFLTRFQLEARAVARLKDPGLVAVYDQGFGTPHDPGQPFLIMELVEGGTLRELLNERGPMPPHAVVAVLRPVLGALGIAHRAGLVHRDVKPENILISDDGEVKVVDFGLVRALAAAGITSTNVILGTAAYLSPEQVRDGNAGPASDVYGVGILAYELLTGHTPFAGDSPLTVAYQRLDRDVPPPSTAIEGVPREFDELVARATALEPADRYADGVEMAQDVTAIAERLGLPAFRVPAPRNSAQHSSAPPQRGGGPAAPPARPTLHMPRGPQDWTPDTDTEADTQYQVVSGQFAGIELSQFVLQRQHARRMVAIWLTVVFALTGLVAAVAWTLGNNVGALL